MSPSKVSPLNDIEATMRVLRTQRYEWVTTTTQSPYKASQRGGVGVGCLGRARGVQRRDFRGPTTARGVVADR